MVRTLYRGHNAHWRVNFLGKHCGLIVCSREFCDIFAIKWSRFNGTDVVELSGQVGQFIYGKVFDGKEWENSLEILGFVFWGSKQGRSRRREEASNLGWPIQSLSSRPLLLGFISLNWPTFCSNIHYTIIQNINDTLNNSQTPRWSFNNITTTSRS